MIKKVIVTPDSITISHCKDDYYYGFLQGNTFRKFILGQYGQYEKYYWASTGNQYENFFELQEDIIKFNNKNGFSTMREAMAYIDNYNYIIYQAETYEELLNHLNKVVEKHAWRKNDL
jgi:hypothetical protein